MYRSLVHALASRVTALSVMLEGDPTRVSRSWMVENKNNLTS